MLILIVAAISNAFINDSSLIHDTDIIQFVSEDIIAKGFAPGRNTACRQWPTAAIIFMLPP